MTYVFTINTHGASLTAAIYPDLDDNQVAMDRAIAEGIITEPGIYHAASPDDYGVCIERFNVKSLGLTAVLV